MLAITALACGAASAIAADSNEVAALAVVAEASGEWWPADGERGHRRIVVTAHGDEHVYTIVRAEWRVIEPDGSKSTRAALDVGGLSDEPLTIVRNVRYVGTRPPGVGVFEATVAHRYEEKTRTVEIRLGAPGEIEIVTPAPPP